MISRYLKEHIEKDLSSKIIILSGPRQVGKTTFSQDLAKEYEYLNFDNDEDRIQILKKQWDRGKELLILDEIHKMNKWKQWLKGVYDKEKLTIPIIVTGSARMDIYRKAGDSLAGRHFHYRMHPLDLNELRGQGSPEQNYKKLMNYSGFPEPFFIGKDSFYNKWKKTHVDLILRQDLLSLELIKDISSFETMLLLLQSRAGSPVSSSSLARDLHKDPKTILNWLNIAENLYFIFSVRPYTKNISRSILKEPKIYFFDLARVEVDEALKLENLVALSLKKKVDYNQDALGIECNLNTLRKKDGKEIDFLITQKNEPPMMIEVKLTEAQPSNNFQLFEKHLGPVKKIQLVKNLTREFTTPNGVEVREVTNWLTNVL